MKADIGPFPSLVKLSFLPSYSISALIISRPEVLFEALETKFINLKGSFFINWFWNIFQISLLEISSPDVSATFWTYFDSSISACFGILMWCSVSNNQAEPPLPDWLLTLIIAS